MKQSDQWPPDDFRGAYDRGRHFAYRSSVIRDSPRSFKACRDGHFKVDNELLDRPDPPVI